MALQDEYTKQISLIWDKWADEDDPWTMPINPIKNTQEKGLNVRRRWLLFQSFFGYADRWTGTGRVLPHGFV